MSYNLYRQQAILAKIEVTEGTDPTPTGSANAVLAGNMQLTPLVATMVDRVAAFPTFGSVGQVPANVYHMVEFDHEGAGSGVVDTPPAYGPLLRMAGFAETVTASTKVEYNPITSPQESGTIYGNQSGILHKLTGARSTFGLKFDKASYPIFSHRVFGRYNAPTATALPSLTTTAWQAPLVISLANTQFTLDGFSAVLESLTIDLGNNLIFRDRPNASYVAITDRNMTGNIQFECPPLGTHDFFALARSGNLVALQLIHGTVAGNITQIDCPKVQLQNPTYVNVDGILHFQASLRINRNSGNDEMKITTK